ncbi:hypothetical protein ACKWTF_014566 [Chironomus riparius]
MTKTAYSIRLAGFPMCLGTKVSHNWWKLFKRMPQMDYLGWILGYRPKNFQEFTKKIGFKKRRVARSKVRIWISKLKRLSKKLNQEQQPTITQTPFFFFLSLKFDSFHLEFSFA